MARREYRDLTILASSPLTEIWLGDDAGHLVQKETGELQNLGELADEQAILRRADQRQHDVCRTL